MAITGKKLVLLRQIAAIETDRATMTNATSMTVEGRKLFAVFKKAGAEEGERVPMKGSCLKTLCFKGILVSLMDNANYTISKGDGSQRMAQELVTHIQEEQAQSPAAELHVQ